MNAKFESIGNRRIYLDQMYFIAYAGGTRDIPEKDKLEYRKILSLPFIAQRKELKRLPLEKNPNVIPLKGIDLISFIKELKFIPFFDANFERTHLLELTDFVIFDAMKQKSYETALAV